MLDASQNTEFCVRVCVAVRREGETLPAKRIGKVSRKSQYISEYLAGEISSSRQGIPPEYGGRRREGGMERPSVSKGRAGFCNFNIFRKIDF